MKEKCNRDCFNCIYEDCITDTITKEERREISERNKRNISPAKVHISRKTRKSKHIVCV